MSVQFALGVLQLAYFALGILGMFILPYNIAKDQVIKYGSPVDFLSDLDAQGRVSFAAFSMLMGLVQLHFVWSPRDKTAFRLAIWARVIESAYYVAIYRLQGAPLLSASTYGFFIGQGILMASLTVLYSPILYHCGPLQCFKLN